MDPAQLPFTIELQPPPRPYLRNYDRLLPASSQLPEIPSTFLSALTVREKVFVDEHSAVPLEHHIDSDDARSCHWVAFSNNVSTNTDDRGELLSSAIGTIRLIPFPHFSPHPEPGAHFDSRKLSEIIPAPASEIFFVEPPKTSVDRTTSFHDGKEPYIKLGRLCVVPEWRGKGVAKELIEEACRWAAKNGGFAVGGRLEKQGNGEGRWEGLICVHAQEGAVKCWERNGFVVDEGMGMWFEGGIKHFGMWRRLRV